MQQLACNSDCEPGPVIDCIHCRGVEGEHVHCASNRLRPLPPAGGTTLRRIAICLKPCPYRNRPNLTEERLREIAAACRPGWREWEPGTAIARGLRRVGLRKKCRGCSKRERALNRAWKRMFGG